MQLGALFPLTLTLSPRERAQTSTIREHSLRHGFLPMRRAILPLPQGMSLTTFIASFFPVQHDALHHGQ